MVFTPPTFRLLRRMVKEKLLKFDGTPLFPNVSHTVPKKLLRWRNAAL
jgi:hypothetical protein